MAKVAALRILDLLLEPAGELSATDIGDTEIQAF
jgi:hypothetical protein